MAFFVEVLVGGLLAGVMYSLVALGFVLIYKASGVFNFAQGAMVFFAATTYAGLVGLGWSGWLAFAASLGVMVVFAIATERFVLRPLVNQPQISLFMATIGLTFVLEGLSQGVWGAEVRGLELGIPDSPLEVKGILISKFDLVAAATAGGLVLALALFFQKTRVGRALRAVTITPRGPAVADRRRKSGATPRTAASSSSSRRRSNRFRPDSRTAAIPRACRTELETSHREAGSEGKSSSIRPSRRKADSSPLFVRNTSREPSSA